MAYDVSAEKLEDVPRTVRVGNKSYRVKEAVKVGNIYLPVVEKEHYDWKEHKWVKEKYVVKTAGELGIMTDINYFKRDPVFYLTKKQRKKITGGKSVVYDIEQKGDVVKWKEVTESGEVKIHYETGKKVVTVGGKKYIIPKDHIVVGYENGKILTMPEKQARTNGLPMSIDPNLAKKNQPFYYGLVTNSNKTEATTPNLKALAAAVPDKYKKVKADVTVTPKGYKEVGPYKILMPEKPQFGKGYSEGLATTLATRADYVLTKKLGLPSEPAKPGTPFTKGVVQTGGWVIKRAAVSAYSTFGAVLGYIPDVGYQVASAVKKATQGNVKGALVDVGKTVAYPALGVVKIGKDFLGTFYYLGEGVGYATKGNYKQAQQALKQSMESGASYIGTVGTLYALNTVRTTAKQATYDISMRVKTIGKTYVPAEHIVDPRVLSGKMRFPLQRKPMGVLYRQFAEGTRYGLERGPGGWHAAPMELPRKTTVLPGTSESPGLYISPSLSKYFLKLKAPKKVEYSLFPENDVMKPAALWVRVKGVDVMPEWVYKQPTTEASYLASWLFMKKYAKAGVAYITPKYYWLTQKFGRMAEPEAVVTPWRTVISRTYPKAGLLKTAWYKLTGFAEYTKIDGKIIPIHRYTVKAGNGILLRMPGLSKVASGWRNYFSTAKSSYESIGVRYEPLIPMPYKYLGGLYVSRKAKPSYKPPSYKPSITDYYKYLTSYKPVSYSYKPYVSYKPVSYSYKPYVSYKPEYYKPYSYKPTSYTSYATSYRPYVSYKPVSYSYKPYKYTPPVTPTTARYTWKFKLPKVRIRVKPPKYKLNLKGIYTPSLTAVFLGIRGKAKTKAFTGFEIRPLPKRWRW